MVATILAGLPFVFMIASRPPAPPEPLEVGELEPSRAHIPRELDEYAIYKLLLAHTKPEYPVVLGTRLSAGSIWDEDLPEAWSPDAIKDYRTRCREGGIIELARIDGVHAIGMTPDQEAAFFDKGCEEGWRKFHAAYPNTAGMMHISPVGFDGARRIAIVAHSSGYGSLGGSGTISRFVFRDGAWCLDNLGYNFQRVS